MTHNIDKIKIGTAGNPANFFSSPYKREIMNCPLWLREIGLSAYEFQATHGVNTPLERAKLLGENGRQANVALSIHAPFFVVLTSKDKEIYERSIGRMVKCIEIAEIEGAEKVIFHPGYYQGDPRRALEQCMKGMEEIIELTKNSRVKICPETGGKKSALGSLDELIAMDKIHKRVELCIDFAHHHARTGGSLKTKADFLNVFDEIEKECGKERIQNLHCHYSRLIYTDKGERSHVSAYEEGMGPNRKLFCESIMEYGLTPTIICETRDTQDIEALAIKKEFEKLSEK
ncbi:MAG: TIM barrel protein [Candidatus Micrarchaeota archaeon]